MGYGLCSHTLNALTRIQTQGHISYMRSLTRSIINRIYCLSVMEALHDDRLSETTGIEGTQLTCISFRAGEAGGRSDLASVSLLHTGGGEIHQQAHLQRPM